jgi:hypothetical protein
MPIRIRIGSGSRNSLDPDLDSEKCLDQQSASGSDGYGSETLVLRIFYLDIAHCGLNKK